jgi:hypothetical protein
MQCGEDMVVALNVDYQKFVHWTEAVENAEHAPEEPGASIINLDANFLVPEEDRHKEGAFPRLQQLHEMTELAEKHGSLVSVADVPKGMLGQRPYRRPDYAEEWRLLRKAWSLHRRGQDHLEKKKVAAASDLLYKHDPLQGLADWQWRFVLFIGQPHYEAAFQNAFEAIRPLMRIPEFKEFASYYNNTADQRGERYFDVESTQSNVCPEKLP